ncbi:hypothetical protein MHK_004107, partial [Candidatus Magnetomorum sp. HK-1]
WQKIRQRAYFRFSVATYIYAAFFFNKLKIGLSHIFAFVPIK